MFSWGHYVQVRYFVETLGREKKFQKGQRVCSTNTAQILTGISSEYNIMTIREKNPRSAMVTEQMYCVAKILLFSSQILTIYYNAYPRINPCVDHATLFLPHVVKNTPNPMPTPLTFMIVRQMKGTTLHVATSIHPYRQTSFVTIF